MIFLKLWFAVCFLFFLSSIHQLVNDARSVKFLYRENDEHSKQSWDFSFCVGLDDMVLENFTKPSKEEYNFTVKELLEVGCLHHFSDEICRKSIFLNRSYLFNYHTCFAFDVDQFNVLVQNSSSVNSFRLFAYFLEQSEIFFFFNIDLFFEKSKPFLLNLIIKEVHLLGKGYQTDCSTYSNEKSKLETVELVYSQPSCFYECFKSRTSRSLSYFYSTKDIKPLIVNQIDLSRSREIYWKISDRHLNKTTEAECTKLCEKISCRLIIYSLDISNSNQETFNITFRLEFSEGVPFFSNFSFVFDFLSLIALFFNISLFVTVPDFAFRLIRKLFFVYLKTYRRYLPVAYLRRIYWTLKISIFSLCLSLLISFSAYRSVQYALANYEVLKSSSFPTEVSPFYLVVCVPVQMFVNNRADLNLQLENDLLRTKSFAELENLTNFDLFRKGIERIYVKYATVRTNINYSINEDKVLFRNYKFGQKGNFLTRCYEITLDMKKIDTRRYEMLFSLSKLRLKAKFHWFVVIPLVSNRQLSLQSEGLFLKQDFVKITFIRKSDCLDYEKSNLNCSSRSTCTDQCILERFRETHLNLTTFTVVEKGEINQTDLNKIYFNNTIDEQIQMECRSKSIDKSCLTEYFQIKNSKAVDLKDKRFVMDLYYSEIIVNEVPFLTLGDLLLNNFLNFLSIFFGFNMAKLFALLFSLLKKFKLVKFPKLYKWFKCLVCLLGFIFHCYVLFYNALYGDLIYIEEFSMFKEIPIPNLIFCFEFDEEKIDSNQKLTYAYLDELTKDINFNFFRNLSFLDENYEYISVDQDELIKGNESTGKLEGLDRFYLINLKCFQFRFRPIKNSRYLYLMKDLLFAKINFDKDAILKCPIYQKSNTSFEFYFINKKANTHELNGIDKLTIELYNRNDSKQLSSIASKLVVFKQQDIFSYVKQPLSLLFETVNLNDTTDYVDELIRSLQKFNLKTRYIPMFGDSDKLEIDDLLADQYYLQFQNVTDFSSPRVIEFDRKIFFSNFIEEQADLDDYDLYFYLSCVYTLTTVTNRDSPSKVVIQVLNCLSFWFNFCVLDIYLYILKFFELFLKLYKLLLVLRSKLKASCDSIVLHQLLNRT